jgi:hypothetical protein
MQAAGIRRSVVASAVAAVAILALGATQAGAKLPVDHYACYAAQLTGGAHPTVKIANQFGSGSLAPTAVASLCAPADKNNGGVINRIAHLTCYGVNHYQGPTKSHIVSITNQFGTLQMTVVLNPPQSLCLPSGKSTASTAPPPVPTTLDHYLCYLVDPGGQFTSRVVVVKDQFGTSKDTVLVPKSLCLPTSKNGSTILHKEVHLLCYAIKSPTNGKHVTVHDQFGILSGNVGNRTRLCVPSLKKVIS